MSAATTLAAPVSAGRPVLGAVRVARGTVCRLAAELALDEAHGLSIGDVDGGEEFESHAGDRICLRGPVTYAPVLVDGGGCGTCRRPQKVPEPPPSSARRRLSVGGYTVDV